MGNFNLGKIVAALAVFVVLATIVLSIAGRGDQKSSGQAVLPDATAPEPRASAPPPVSDAATARLEPARQQDVGVDFDWHKVLTNQIKPPKIPREEVENYLERSKRAAPALLAAYHALGDTNYLKEAASKFPNDARVGMSVLDQDLFPNERRKWLDLFKASAPDNPLANYLSARDYLKNGQVGPAMAELEEAATKPAFNDYAMQSKLDEEQLNMAAGRSSAQAIVSASGWTEDLIPELTSLKELAQGIAALQGQYLTAGDSASAQNLAEVGLGLANGLRSNDGGKIVIEQLVGNSIEASVLSQLDPTANYDFLNGQTPSDRLAELKQQKSSLDGLRQTLMEALPRMTEADLVSYTERQRLYGELQAMRWLQQSR